MAEPEAEAASSGYVQHETPAEPWSSGETHGAADAAEAEVETAEPEAEPETEARPDADVAEQAAQPAEVGTGGGEGVEDNVMVRTKVVGESSADQPPRRGWWQRLVR